MDKTRALPVLATAAIALSLAACSSMGGHEASSGSPSAQASNQPSSTYPPTTQRQSASAAPSHRRTASAVPRAQVREVQQNLADRGYDPGPVDGLWGPRTRQAVRTFQRDQNLAANGRADHQTLAALGIETGSPATQTGQLPAERSAPAPQVERSTVVPPSERGALPPQQNPGDVDVQQRDVPNPSQQQGLLPPTGSQAPGAARESERAPVAPGGAPDTRLNVPTEQTPEAPAGSR